MMKIQTRRSYISYIDWSVVCIYPLLRSHVVERSCRGNNDKTVGMWNKDCGLHRGVSPCSVNMMIIFTKKHFFVAHISETSVVPPPPTVSLFWEGTEGKGEWDTRGEAQRQKGHHRQSWRTLLVRCDSLLRLIGQWWGTWDTGVSQMVEDVATSHLPLGCDPTHLAKNIPRRLPKLQNQHFAVQYCDTMANLKVDETCQLPHLVLGCWLKAACLLRRTSRPPP